MYAGSAYILGPPQAAELPDDLSMYLWFTSIELALIIMCARLLIFDRLRYFFECYVICLLPWTLRQERRQSIRFLMQLLVLGAAVADFVVINLLRPEWGSIIPYRFFFQ